MADEFWRGKYGIVVIRNAIGTSILPRFVVFFTVWTLFTFRVTVFAEAIPLLCGHIFLAISTTCDDVFAMVATLTGGAGIATQIVIAIGVYVIV